MIDSMDQWKNKMDRQDAETMAGWAFSDMQAAIQARHRSLPTAARISEECAKGSMNKALEYLERLVDRRAKCNFEI